MKRYAAMDVVRRGVYLNLATFEFIWLHGQNPSLPPDSGATYVKVPAVMAIAAAPLAGFLLIMALPVISIIGTVGLLFRKLLRGGSRA